MTTDAQKEMEVYFAEKAAENLGEIWIVKPSPDEKEWPDLLVTHESKEFGLEVRELYPDESRKGSKKRAIESRNHQAINSIAEKYYEISENTIKVDFLGNIENEDAILSELKTVESDLGDFEHVRFEPYRGLVVHVTKLPSKLGKYKRWAYVSDEVGWVGELTNEKIQEKVNEKSKEIEKYSKNLSDVRLLLVCNRRLNSGKFTYAPSGAIDCGGFKEIYFLSYPDSVFRINS